MIKKQLKKIFHLFGYTVYNHKVYEELAKQQTPSKYIQQRGILLDDVKFIDNSKIEIKSLDLCVDFDKHRFIFDKFRDLSELKEKNKAIFTNENNDIFISIDDIKFCISTGEEISILREVFTDGIYNIYPNSETSCILVDIGMNVGITSLFFANKSKIIKTYSFEPFPETYNAAKRNIEFNPKIASKINAYNWGVGIENKSDTWIYNYDYKGSMGVNGLPAHVSYLDKEKNESITISIKDISDVFTQVKSDNPNTPIILKIDCEGSEYSILKKMNEKKLFDNIFALMIEWHVHGPKDIIEYLKNNGYSTFSFFEHDTVIGMLYALKTNK